MKNKISGSKALNNIKENKYSRWSFPRQERNSLDNLAINRINDTDYQPNIDWQLDLDPTAKIFAMGSCFAREIEFALERKKFEVSSAIFPASGQPNDNDKLMSIADTANVHPSEALNRYSLPSMLQEFKNLYSNGAYLSNKLIYETSDGIFTEAHYTSAFPPLSFDEVNERREIIVSSLAGAIISADVFIITFGLNEYWVDLEQNLVLNTIPSPQFLKKYSDRLQYEYGDFHSLLDNAQEIVELINSKNPNAKIVVTVSPVPLEYTFFQGDIVLRNHAAKNMLHSVAQSITSIENVVYFPSYEMVQYSKKSSVWKDDGRHIKSEFVEKITSLATSKIFRGV